MTIANHYRQLRQIPDVNLLHLEWSGSRESIDVQTFRDRILRPIFTEIDRRGIDDQIDYIVYSSDSKRVGLMAQVGKHLYPFRYPTEPIMAIFNGMAAGEKADD